MPALNELGPVPRFFFARIFPWFIVALGALTLYLGFGAMYRGWASNGWPTVPGVVTTSRIETERGTGSSSNRTGSRDSYHARVSYDYQVAGETYTGRRVHAGEYGTADTAHAEEVIGSYPLGAEVVVHHHPRRPGDAVLEPGLHGVPWF